MAGPFQKFFDALWDLRCVGRADLSVFDMSPPSASCYSRLSSRPPQKAGGVFSVWTANTKYIVYAELIALTKERFDRLDSEAPLYFAFSSAGQYSILVFELSIYVAGGAGTYPGFQLISCKSSVCLKGVKAAALIEAGGAYSCSGYAPNSGFSTNGNLH